MPNDQQDWTSVVARPQTQLAGSPWTYNTGGDSKTFTLAPNTSIVGILLPSYNSVSFLSVTGSTSAITYLKVNPSASLYQQYYYVPIVDAVDTQVLVIVTGTLSAKAYVVSVPDPVGVLSIPAVPPPWQAPNQPPLGFKLSNPGPLTNINILPVPPLFTGYYLHSAVWEYSGVAAGQTAVWEDSNGVAFLFDDATTAGGPRFMDFKGAAMAQNQPLIYRQVGAAVAGTYTVSGSITYSVF